MSMDLNGLSPNYNTSTLGNNNTRFAKKDAFTSIDNNSNSESPLAEAIRLYRSFVLTGVKELSSEEKEEIQSLIEDYLTDLNFLERYGSGKAKNDYAAVNDYIKRLYKQFGSKGDFYEFVTDFVQGMLEKAVDPNNPPCPPFKAEIPPELALTNKSKKPLLMPFQSLSPHQFLMTDDNTDNS